MAMVSTIFKGSNDRKKKMVLFQCIICLEDLGPKEVIVNPPHDYQGNFKPKQNLLELSGLISFGHTLNYRSVIQHCGGFGSDFLYESVFSLSKV